MAKQTKSVGLLGYSTSPSEYACKDGDLALSMGVLNEGNGLRPLGGATVVSLLPAGYEVIYIHKTADYVHYIIRGPKPTVTSVDRYYWAEKESLADAALYTVLIEEIVIDSITAMGNTLMLLTKGKPVMLLWTQLTGAVQGYENLGSGLPEIECSFGLRCRIEQTVLGETVQVRAPTISGPQGELVPVINPGSDAEKAVTKSVMATVNKFMKEKIRDSNRFCQPFFVRYAYRLYDGTITKQSPPILMLPTNGMSPTVLAVASRIDDDDANVNIIYWVTAPACELNINPGAPRNFWKYRDVIKAVEVYVSEPIYTYDQEGDITGVDLFAKDNDSGIYSKDDIDGRYEDPLLSKLKKYMWWRFFDSYKVSKGGVQYPPLKIGLPKKNTESIDNSISRCSSFYLVKSYSIDELPATREVVDIETGALNTLQQHASLPDDYDSHDVLMPGTSYVYNSRMHLAGLRKELYGGVMGQCYQTGYVSDFVYDDSGRVTDAVDHTDECMTVREMYVYIRRGGKEIIVRSTPNVMISCRLSAPWHLVTYFYHPDAAAEKVEMYGTYNGETIRLQLHLKRHEMLNGSYYYEGLRSIQGVDVPSSMPEESVDKTVNVYNEIYVSEVGNPFNYPAGRVVTVGMDKIIAMRSASKAMSTAQYGQYPLYVFTESGVWALPVTSDGGYGAPSLLPRAICKLPGSIVQLESTVLYVSERGIMQLSGSEVLCISDSIYNDETTDLALLPMVEDFYAVNESGVPSVVPVAKYLDSVEMIYDNRHQRVIVYNTKIDAGGSRYGYALVWSVKSRLWGMMPSQIKSRVDGYPEALLMTYNRRLVTLSEETEADTEVCLITRPLKLEAPDLIKTIRMLWLNGMFDRGRMSLALWGSRDMYTWHWVGSSVQPVLRHLSGTGYKYFRVGIVGKMKNNESLNYITIEMVERRYDR